MFNLSLNVNEYFIFIIFDISKGIEQGKHLGDPSLRQKIQVELEEEGRQALMRRLLTFLQVTFLPFLDLIDFGVPIDDSKLCLQAKMDFLRSLSV